MSIGGGEKIPIVEGTANTAAFDRRVMGKFKSGGFGALPAADAPAEFFAVDSSGPDWSTVEKRCIVCRAKTSLADGHKTFQEDVAGLVCDSCVYTGPDLEAFLGANWPFQRRGT